MGQRTRERSRGFSLIEMLVVLGVLAALMAMAWPSFQRSKGSVDLASVAIDITSRLRATRAQSIGTNRAVAFVVDRNAPSYAVDQAQPVALPASIAIMVEPMRESRRVNDANRMTFYPNGTASGGRVTLTQDRQRTVITVDGLTGAVLIDRDAP